MKNLLIVFSCAVLVIAYLYMSNKSGNTSSSYVKNGIYYNKIYNFSFQLPDDWKVDATNKGKKQEILISAFNPKKEMYFAIMNANSTGITYSNTITYPLTELKQDTAIAVLTLISEKKKRLHNYDVGNPILDSFAGNPCIEFIEEYMMPNDNFYRERALIFLNNTSYNSLIFSFRTKINKNSNVLVDDFIKIENSWKWE